MNKKIRNPIWVILLIFVSIAAVASTVEGIIGLAITSSYFDIFYVILIDIVLIPSLLMLMTILSKWNSILSIPIGGFALFKILDNTLFLFIYFQAGTLIHIVLYLAIFVVSIFAFVLSVTRKTNSASSYINRPSKIDNPNTCEVHEKCITNSSLEDILKAKKLLDAKAITEEEFLKIKKRMIG